jgi:hypothetical protein
VHARTAEEDWVPQNGARVAAKAWVDPAFKQCLLEKGTAAVAEFGLSMPPHHRRLCPTPWCKKRGSLRAIRAVARPPALDAQAGYTFERAHVCCDRRQVRGQRMCRDEQVICSDRQAQGTQVLAESSAAGVCRRFRRKDLGGG